MKCSTLTSAVFFCTFEERNVRSAFGRKIIFLNLKAWMKQLGHSGKLTRATQG